MVLVVPVRDRWRLNQPIFVYKLPCESFDLMKEDTAKARIYLTHENVGVVGVKSFENVKEAVEFYDGRVEIV